MSTSVIFHWNGPDNKPFQGEGVTPDKSFAGAFVLTAICPPPNAAVQMEVLLPPLDSASKARMKADMTHACPDNRICGCLN
jgi:hypothetical protein